MGVVHT